VKLGRDFGVSDDDIRALIDDTAGRPTQLDDMTKTVLRAAREMTQDGAMSDATFAALRQTLGNELIVDLTVHRLLQCCRACSRDPADRCGG
jgi:lysozyme family protein